MSVEHCSQTAHYQRHLFVDHERRTLGVVALTAVMMLVEIIGGTWFGSMALLADGFHMGTHVGALGISAFAYGYARRHLHDPKFSFGTGKVSDLAGFTSAIILGMIAFYVIYESVSRLLTPIPIVYGEAMAIAALGLAVNIASARMLGAGGDAHHHHHHDHVHKHGHDHSHHQHDNNFRSAYIHVIADAVTSVLALIALGCGWALGWSWMDPVMGIVGAFVIISWSISLIRDTSSVLLDRTPQTELAERVRHLVSGEGAEVKDLHIWRVGPGANAIIIAIKSTQPLSAVQIRNLLKPLDFVHVTIEIT